eukprot:TRINITY_DN11942_c0_g1_i1.p1 TRINITY_DN11942_c0_g1~~TRINITY_DN11942_c0_g1_i1.p1  ORF type:complete len:150 (+),score=35.21 TRINITY_DN11942_c0_g1_i1:901-1350(+)
MYPRMHTIDQVRNYMEAELLPVPNSAIMLSSHSSTATSDAYSRASLLKWIITAMKLQVTLDSNQQSRKKQEESFQNKVATSIQMETSSQTYSILLASCCSQSIASADDLSLEIHSPTLWIVLFHPCDIMSTISSDFDRIQSFFSSSSSS